MSCGLRPSFSHCTVVPGLMRIAAGTKSLSFEDTSTSGYEPVAFARRSTTWSNADGVAEPVLLLPPPHAAVSTKMTLQKTRRGRRTAGTLQAGSCARPRGQHEQFVSRRGRSRL